MRTPTRLQRWISDKLVEQGHEPLPELVASLRAQPNPISWRQCAAQITALSGETVTDVSLINWFGAADQEAAA